MIIPRTANGITIIEKTPERGALVDVDPDVAEQQLAESETTTLGEYPHVTANRLARFDTNKVLQSVDDLTSWIAAGFGISVADDGDGTVTLSTIAGITRIDHTDSPYTVLSTDQTLYCDTDGGAITASLLAGVNGTIHNIKNVGSSGNDVTVTPNGTEEIEGEDDATLEDAWAYTIQFETTENWRVV